MGGNFIPLYPCQWWRKLERGDLGGHGREGCVIYQLYIIIRARGGVCSRVATCHKPLPATGSPGHSFTSLRCTTLCNIPPVRIWPSSRASCRSSASAPRSATNTLSYCGGRQFLLLCPTAPSDALCMVSTHQFRLLCEAGVGRRLSGFLRADGPTYRWS